MPVRILHFADLHLGVENYGRLNPETGLNTRFEDFQRTLNYVVDQAIALNVDAVLFAGDAYKNRDPSPTHQRTFAAALRRLSRAEIPTVVVVGNHDVPNTRGRAHAVEVFRTLEIPFIRISDTPEVVRLETRSGPLQVITLPHKRPSFVAEQENLRKKDRAEVLDAVASQYIERFELLAADLVPGIPAVLLGHFCVSGASAGSERSMTLADEPIVPVGSLVRPDLPIDYIALGHMHRRQDLNARSYPPVVYSGSLERVDFGEENDEKGFVIAEVSRGGTTFQFHDVPARRFITVECDLSSDTPAEELGDLLRKRDVSGAIVRLRYRVPEEKKAQISSAQIGRLLSNSFCVGRVEREVVQSDFRQRDPQMTEAISSLQALERYLQVKPPRSDPQTVLEYGRALILEVEGQGTLA